MKIDRHIPMPLAPAKREPIPVDQMAIGDSIYFPNTTRPSATGRLNGASMARRLGYRFRSAPEGDGARVWRIA